MVVGMAMEEHPFRMVIPMKELINLINAMVVVCIDGMTDESMMECSPKTNVMERASLNGPMVPFTMVNLLMDNVKDMGNIPLVMAGNILVHGKMDGMMDLGKLYYNCWSIKKTCYGPRCCSV